LALPLQHRHHGYRRGLPATPNTPRQSGKSSSAAGHGRVAANRGELRANQVVIPRIVLDREDIFPPRFSLMPDFQMPGDRGIAYSRVDFVKPRFVRLMSSFAY
jgi:hypothetical protein